MRIKQFSKRRIYIKPFTKKFSQNGKTTMLNQYIPRDYLKELLKSPAKKQMVEKLIIDELKRAATQLAKKKTETLQWKYKTKDRNDIIDNLISDIYIGSLGPILKDIEEKGYNSDIEGTYKLPFERAGDISGDPNLILEPSDVILIDGIKQAMCPACKAVGETISLWPNSAGNSLDEKKAPNPIRYGENKYCGNWKEIGKDITEEEAKNIEAKYPKYRKIVNMNNKRYLACMFINNLTPFSYYIKNVADNVYFKDITETYKEEKGKISLDTPVGQPQGEDKERYRGVGIESYEPEEIEKYVEEITSKIKNILGEKDYELFALAADITRLPEKPEILSKEERLKVPRDKLDELNRKEQREEKEWQIQKYLADAFVNVLKPGGGEISESIKSVSNFLLDKRKEDLEKILGKEAYTKCQDCGEIMSESATTCTEAGKLRNLIYDIYTSMPEFDKEEIVATLKNKKINDDMAVHFRKAGIKAIIDNMEKLYPEIEVEEDVEPVEFEVREEEFEKKEDEVKQLNFTPKLFNKSQSFCRIQKTANKHLSKYEFDKKMIQLLGDNGSYYLGTNLDKKEKREKTLFEETKDRLEESIEKIRKSSELKEQFIELQELKEKAETKKISQE